MSDYWYAFNTGDYAKKTATLSMIEHGAYRLLLDHYYNVGPGMEANATGLLRVCRAFAADEQAAVQSILDKFFELRDGKYYNSRADEELEKRSKLRKTRAEAGAKGGAKAKAKRAAKAVANGKQLPPQSQSHLSSPSGKESVIGTTAQKKSAVDPITKPGWEAQYPAWQSVRQAIGDAAWSIWLGHLTPASENVIHCQTPYQAGEIPVRYGAMIEKFVGEVQFVVVKPDGPKTAGSSVSG